LAELGKYVTSYPASSTILNQQFGSGQLDIIPTIVSMDIQNRYTGSWAPDTAVSMFDNQPLVTDGHFFMVPEGVSAETLYVDLKLVSYVLGTAQQVETLGPVTLTAANKDATLDKGTAEQKAIVEKWGRPDFYPKAFAGKTVGPLDPPNMQKAFDLWQRNVGSKVGG